MITMFSLKVFCIRTLPSLWLANLSLWDWQIINRYPHLLMLLQLCISIYCFCERLNRPVGENKQELLEKHHFNLKGSIITPNKLEKLCYHTERWLVAVFTFIFFQVQWQIMMFFSTSFFILNKYLTPCSTLNHMLTSVIGWTHNTIF